MIVAIEWVCAQNKGTNVLFARVTQSYIYTTFVSNINIIMIYELTSECVNKCLNFLRWKHMLHYVNMLTKQFYIAPIITIPNSIDGNFPWENLKAINSTLWAEGITGVRHTCMRCALFFGKSWNKIIYEFEIRNFECKWIRFAVCTCQTNEYFIQFFSLKCSMMNDDIYTYTVVIGRYIYQKNYHRILSESEVSTVFSLYCFSLQRKTTKYFFSTQSTCFHLFLIFVLCSCFHFRNTRNLVHNVTIRLQYRLF